MKRILSFEKCLSSVVFWNYYYLNGRQAKTNIYTHFNYLVIYLNMNL